MRTTRHRSPLRRGETFNTLHKHTLSGIDSVDYKHAHENEHVHSPAHVSTCPHPPDAKHTHHAHQVHHVHACTTRLAEYLPPTHSRVTLSLTTRHKHTHTSRTTPLLYYFRQESCTYEIRTRYTHTYLKYAATLLDLRGLHPKL